VKDSSIVFEELKSELVPLLRKIKKSSADIPKLPKKKFPLAEQKELVWLLSRHIGFDFSAGCIEESAHPFTSGFHPLDVRFTTRYDERDLYYALGSTLHEAGHALYEQGLPGGYLGTPLAEAASLGVHESQSRFWENMVGRNKSFWQFAYPIVKKKFPEQLKGYTAEKYFRALHQSIKYTHSYRIR
jgi:carboxypeptidase Taq